MYNIGEIVILLRLSLHAFNVCGDAKFISIKSIFRSYYLIIKKCVSLNSGKQLKKLTFNSELTILDIHYGYRALSNLIKLNLSLIVLSLG